MKICFPSLNFYPLLTGKNLGYAGGAEVQQVHLGKELLSKGYEVCFVTYHHGKNKIENMNGIEIIKTYDREKAGKINTILKYEMIWVALERANANVYFYEAGSSGVLPLFCSFNRKKFVYRIASDAVVLSKPLSGNYGLGKKVRDLIDIKKADTVIAQSEFQKRILRERFEVESVVIKNGLYLPQTTPNKLDPPVVLWVGSISRVKRPELFVELAKSMPDVRFEMIGGKTNDNKLYEYVIETAGKLPNFKYHGFIPYHQINTYFEKASVFVSTSDIEGFPNVFIQACANYTPIVSLNVDPDNIIKNEKIGFHSRTFKQLILDIYTLVKDERLRKIVGENARKYVEREHDIRKNVNKYIQVFNKIK